MLVTNQNFNKMTNQISTELVYEANGKLVTTSRKIADKFGKRHADLLRAVEKLECPDDFTQRNFAFSEYLDPTGRRLPEYIITKDGFSFLVMGFTGKNAAKFKVDYINRFNEMENAIKSSRDNLYTMDILRLAMKSEEERLKLASDNQVLQIENASLKPKAQFADAIAGSKTSILIGDFAKILRQNGVDIGQNRFFEWLRQNGYLISREGESKNMPTQKAMNLNLFEIKETLISKPDGFQIITKTAKITGFGQTYFLQKFISN